MSKITADVDFLTDAMMTVFEPLVNSLDELRGSGTDGDNGQELPSQKDRGIQIFLDSLLRQSYRQIYGEISARDGRKFDNTVDRWNKSQQQLAEFEKQYANDKENMFIDPLFLQAASWAEINEHRYDAYTAIHISLARIYKEITGIEWKYTELQQPAVTLTRNAEMSARFKARYA